MVATLVAGRVPGGLEMGGVAFVCVGGCTQGGIMRLGKKTFRGYAFWKNNNNCT